MRTTRQIRFLTLGLLSGSVMFQLAGCFGGDPAGYFTAIITSTVVSEVVSALFGAVTTSLGA